jgi:hypothetical protein
VVAWAYIFAVSSVVAIVTMVFPLGGLNALATILVNGSLLALCITGLGKE